MIFIILLTIITSIKVSANNIDTVTNASITNSSITTESSIITNSSIKTNSLNSNNNRIYSINNDLIKFLIIPCNLGQYTDTYANCLIDTYLNQDLGIIQNGNIEFYPDILKSFMRSCYNTSYLYDKDKDNYYILSGGGVSSSELNKYYPMSDIIMNDYKTNQNKYFAYKDFTNYGNVCYFPIGTIFIENPDTLETHNSLYAYTYNFNQNTLDLSNKIMMYTYEPNFMSGKSNFKDLSYISVLFNAKNYTYNYDILEFIDIDKCKLFINNLISSKFSYFKIPIVCITMPQKLNLQIIQNTNLDIFLSDLKNYIQDKIDNIPHNDNFLDNYYKLLADCSSKICYAYQNYDTLTLDTVFFNQQTENIINLYDLYNLIAYGIAWLIWLVIVVFIVIICFIIYKTLFKNIL